MKCFLPVLILLIISCNKEVNTIITPTPIVVNKKDTIVNQIDTQFNGYKVDVLLKTKDEINYWRDCGVIWDVISEKTNIRPDGTNGTNFLPQLICGDFNNDGWIDIFNPGTSLFNGKNVDNPQWLIWDVKEKKFISKNLFNSSLPLEGPRRSITYDINNDGYTDIVVFDSGDDYPPNGKRETTPMKIILSDGLGKYNVTTIKGTENIYNHSGDIGDLDGDRKMDLVIATGNTVYIMWGFPSTNITKFDIWENPQNNTFIEGGGGVYLITIADVNKDGYNDIIEGSVNNLSTSVNNIPFTLSSRILLNQGKGVFNKNGLIMLPYRQEGTIDFDFKIMDDRTDTTVKIITTSAVNYTNSSFGIYTVNFKNKTATYDNSMFIGKTSEIWKPWLIYHDFNNDGVKDLSYIDAHNFNKQLSNKLVFINKNGIFEGISYDVKY